MSTERVREAALRAVELAELAAARGTFGVGGVLLGPHFEPLHQCLNRVVADGQTIDPTAHVERQLIDWYFAEQRGGAMLPPPERCTIISSLDPCMQCTGAILAAGFRCLAIAEDSMAGVHYAGWGSLGSLPQELRNPAARLLGCFAVRGERGYSGPDDPILGASEIDSELLARSEHAFIRTLDAVQAMIAAAGSDGPLSGEAPTNLPMEHDHFRIEPVRDLAPETICRRMQDLTPVEGDNPRDVACFVDARSGLGAFARGRTGASPISTAIMELIRGYTRLRWEAARRHSGAPAHPKHCTLYTLDGPCRGPLDVMAIGAVGSTLEGPVAQPEKFWRYFRATQPAAALGHMLQAFPPLYRDVIRLRPTLID